MKIIIYWAETERSDLVQTLNRSLEELGLTDFIKVEETDDSKIKDEMWIKSAPALIIEEESIEFKDTIFEWQTPSEDEIKSMLISIIGWESAWGCGSKDESGSCGTWCAC